MELKEKIVVRMQIFVFVLLSFFLLLPLFILHNKIVNVLADLTVKIVKYFFGS